MNQPPVTRLIELITPRLPLYKVVGRDLAHFSGRELMLTGIKEFKGEPIYPDHAYSIEIPRISFYNHPHRMRLHWLAEGMQGVFDYLEPFLSPDSLNKLKYRFMHIAEQKEAVEHA